TARPLVDDLPHVFGCLCRFSGMAATTSRLYSRAGQKVCIERYCRCGDMQPNLRRLPGTSRADTDCPVSQSCVVFGGPGQARRCATPGTAFASPVLSTSTCWCVRAVAG